MCIQGRDRARTGPALALVMAGALPSWAVAQPAATAASYPASTESPAVLAWLKAATSVKPTDIVAIGPQAVMSLDGVTAGPQASSPITALVREEIIDPGYAQRREARSARLEVEIDCAGGAYRIRHVNRFLLPDLKGVGVEVAAPAEAGHAAEGSAMSRIIGAACMRKSTAVVAAAPREPKPAPVSPPPKIVALAEAKPPARPDPAPPPVVAPVVAKPAAKPSDAVATAPPEPKPAPIVVAQVVAQVIAKPDPAPPAAAPTAPSPPKPAPAAPPPEPKPVAVAAAAPAKPAPAPTPFRVQLGTYSTAENAKRAGADLKRDHAKAMGGYETLVDQSSGAGRGYFLLWVKGFAARADASAFCKAVDVAPGGCIIRR
jgi:hypothetical protein